MCALIDVTCLGVQVELECIVLSMAPKSVTKSWKKFFALHLFDKDSKNLQDRIFDPTQLDVILHTANTKASFLCSSASS